MDSVYIHDHLCDTSTYHQPLTWPNGLIWPSSAVVVTCSAVLVIIPGSAAKQHVQCGEWGGTGRKKKQAPQSDRGRGAGGRPWT